MRKARRPRAERQGAAAVRGGWRERVGGAAAAAQVDIWALGISVIEMAEVVPPRHAVHPMRVIFQITREAPPRLADQRAWSPAMHDFLARCLQKAPPLPRPPPPIPHFLCLPAAGVRSGGPLHSAWAGQGHRF